MRTLGVNGAGDVLYLAVAEEGRILDVQPYTFREPAGLEARRRLAALRDEAAKLVHSLAIERVRILDAEPTYQTSVSSVYQRVALETVLNLGTTEAGIDCTRLSRARLRSILSLPRSGQLVSLVAQVTPQVGSHWGPRKRDLAALAALAAEREA